MTAYLLPAAFFLLSIALSVVAGSVFHLSGTPLLLLRIALVLVGAIAAALTYWFWRRQSTPSTDTAVSPREDSELQTFLRSASQRLQTAQRRGANSIASLPLLYVLGEPNSGKTTAISKSGMDPELLAGQVYQDNSVIATRQFNVWYADGAVFLDAGELLTRNASQWTALVKKTTLGLLSSLTRSQRPLRAAVVCISSEVFFGSGTAEKLIALSRETNAALRAIARQLGTDLPVHVVLTKLDCVVGFAEYVQHLTHEEAAERLGITFPNQNLSNGVYAEQATAAISASLDQLFFSLGEFRLEMLGRENGGANSAGIYQFPREMQKLRNHLITYLVELTRPSHLNANPVLRSFSAIGVRARVLEQTFLAPAEKPRTTFAESDATGIFSLREVRDAVEQPLRSGAARRVAEWCFLPQLFPRVFLAKDDLETSAAANPRVRLLRRAALATACLAFVIWLAGLTGSYVQNAALERNIREAAALLPSNPSTVDFANMQQLAALDRLRLALLQLRDFERNGAPMRYRWGLYRGHALLSPARSLYFARFRWILLDATQSRIRSGLNALPATAPADADYRAAYNPLRAYLITTDYPQYSSGEFLSTVLTPAWAVQREKPSDDLLQLASEQFRFFGDELRLAPIYRIAPNEQTVGHARAYLNSFGSVDRVYQNMLAAAERTSPAIDFNRLYPGSSATVIESHIVPGAFTRTGYSFMQAAIQNPEHFFTGEPWVLGDKAPLSASANDLTPKLATRYAADFNAQWLTYLRSASVVRFRSLSDAGQKLGMLSSPSSALLALIFTASQNTAMAAPQVANRFQPAQALVPASLNSRLIAPSNTTYINGLVSLQGAVSQLAQDPNASNNPNATQGVIAAAASAHGAVSQTAQSFNIDPQDHVEQIVTRILQEPINSVESNARGAAPAQSNAAGRQFCLAMSPVLSKYPFDRNASTEATPSEVTALLKPDTGALWQFYANSLKSLLVQQGSQWVAAPTATIKPTPQFLQMFNHLATLSNGFYPTGAATPSLQFIAHILKSPDIESVTLDVDGQRASGANITRNFHWSAQSAQGAQLIASYGSNNLPLQFNGTWALFHLVDRGRIEQTSPTLRLAYPLQISGTPIVVNGTALTERIELSGSDILNPAIRTGIRCTAQVTR